MNRIKRCTERTKLPLNFIDFDFVATGNGIGIVITLNEKIWPHHKYGSCENN